MRPKVEQYEGEVRLVILRTARYDDDGEEVKFGEISVFLAPRFVITVRLGVAGELREARHRLEHRPELLRRAACRRCGRSWIRWSTGTHRWSAGSKQDIDQIESTVFSGTVAPTEWVYLLRREVTQFYRAVHPLLAVVGTVERGAAPKTAAVPA